MKDEDPTPLPHLANSIKLDDRQVVKFFLWGISKDYLFLFRPFLTSPCSQFRSTANTTTVEKYGSSFTLIRTFFLPKRRSGKGDKPAEPVMRPRRDSTGNTNGFVRRARKVAKVVKKKKAAISDGADSENGEGKINAVVNENVTGGAHANGSPVEKKKSRRSKADSSSTFVRRSSRRVGASAEKIDGVVLNGLLGEIKEEEGSSSLNGSRLGDKMDVDTPAANTINNASNAPSQVEQNIDMGVNEQEALVGGMGEVEDRGGSSGMSYSTIDDNIPRFPPVASDTVASIPKEDRPSRPRIKLLLAPRTSANKRNKLDTRPSSPSLFPVPSTPPKNTNDGPSRSLPSLPPLSTPPNYMSNAHRLALIPSIPDFASSTPRTSTTLPPQFPALARFSSSINSASFPPFPPPGTYAVMETIGATLSPYQAFMQSNARSPHLGNGMADSTSTGDTTTATFPPPFNSFYHPTASYRSPYGPVSIPTASNEAQRGSNSTISAPDVDDVFSPRPQADGYGGNEEMQERQSEVLPSTNELPSSDLSELFEEESLDLIEMATHTPKIGDRVRLAGDQSSPLHQRASSDDMDWQA